MNPALIDRQSMRLSAGQFVAEPQSKDLIVIHHTVGGSAKSTFDYWQAQPERTRIIDCPRRYGSSVLIS